MESLVVNLTLSSKSEDYWLLELLFRLLCVLPEAY